MKKSILAIIVLAGLIGYGIYDYYDGTTDENLTVQEDFKENVTVGIGKGERAPNFELFNLEGVPVQLSDYRGKKVLVNFWATWCPPCRAEMPHMQQFYENYEDEVVVLGVNMTATESDIEAVPAFVEEFGLTFPIVLDEEGDVWDAYQVFAYPTTLALDENGIIREVFRGAVNYEIMKQTIEKM